MKDWISSLPNLSILLDFERLIKNISVKSFQERLKYLLSQIDKEILLAKIELQNPDNLDKMIEMELNEAIQYSGGDLVTIEPLILQIFQYYEFNLDTSLDIEKLPIRSILKWAPDSEWSYNDCWEEWKKREVLELPFYITSVQNK